MPGADARGARGAPPRRHAVRPAGIRSAAARPGPRDRGRPGSRWLAWAGVLGGLLLVVAAAVTPPAVAAAPAAGCGRRICQPLAFVQLSTSQSYQGSSIAVSGGKVLLNSTDNTVTPDAPAQTNLYVLALPES